MKKLFVTGMTLSMLLSFGIPVKAQEAPKLVFDATYTSSNPAGSSIVRMISDGKGHMRTETVVNGSKMVSIMDYPAKSVFTIMDEQKMVMKSPLVSSPDVHDDESAKKSNAKSLGAKTIAGHPCHGWEYKTPQGTTAVWIGDDTKYMVKSESIIANGMKSTTEIKSWSRTVPAGTQFTVPADYKMMVVPQQK